MKHLFSIRWFDAMHWSPMIDSPLFWMKYHGGDEYHRASLWVEWRWRGRGHWLLIFLPDFLP